MLHDRFRADRMFSRWRVRPCYGEPGNSYFPRLTLDSESCLPETFAKKSGLWVGEKRSLNLLEEMTNLPLTEGEKASLFRWTPIQSDTSRYWSLGEEEVSMTHIRPGGFSCPACLRDGAFHRVWWDFRMFQTCPVHDCAMQENPLRHDRRWPYYGLCLKKVETPPILSARGRESFEEYLLQRLKAVEPIVDRPMLDDAPLTAVLAIMPRVGMFLRNPPIRTMPGNLSTDDIKTGFEALSQDEEHLVDRFSEWLRRHYHEDELHQVGLRQFGFMRHLTKSTSVLKRAVNAAQIKACTRHGLLNPKIRSRPGVEAPLVKSNIHSALGLTLYSADILLERQGIDLRKGTREIVEIPEETVARMRAEVETAVPLEEAARQLGCSVEQVDMVAVKLSKKGWRTCIQTRHEGGLRRRFLESELRKLVGALEALPIVSQAVQTTGLRARARRGTLSETKLMADALRGTIAAFRDPEREGLSGLRFYKVKRGAPASIGRTKVPPDAMLWSEFNAMTGVSSAGIKRLISRGHLAQHPSKSSYVSRASAIAFGMRYITPIRCFRAAGMDFKQASNAVQVLDIPVAFSRKEVGLTIVERQRFMSLFPDFQRPSRESLGVWNDLVRLGKENCPSFIIPEEPGDGVFSIFPTSRILSVDVVLRGAEIRFEIEVRPYFRRMWKIFQELGPDFRAILASFEWDETEDYIRLSTTVTDIYGIERVTKEFGRLNEHFRYKMP